MCIFIEDTIYPKCKIPSFLNPKISKNQEEGETCPLYFQPFSTGEIKNILPLSFARIRSSHRRALSNPCECPYLHLLYSESQFRFVTIQNACPAIVEIPRKTSGLFHYAPTRKDNILGETCPSILVNLQRKISKRR